NVVGCNRTDRGRWWWRGRRWRRRGSLGGRGFGRWRLRQWVGFFDLWRRGRRWFRYWRHWKLGELPYFVINPLEVDNPFGTGIEQPRFKDKKCHQKQMHQDGNNQRFSALWWNL